MSASYDSQKEKCLSAGRYAIRAKRGKNNILTTDMPKMEAAVKREAARLENAVQRLADAKALIIANEAAVEELVEDCNTIDDLDRLRTVLPEEEVSLIENRAYNRILRYTSTSRGIGAIESGF